MQRKEFLKRLDEICHPELAEEWDNTGVQIDMGYPKAEKILVALEITDSVIDEAMNAEADWIVTHHPLIFTSTSSIDYEDNPGRYIERLIRAGISVYSAHTSFDKMEGGNNDYLGRILGFEKISKPSGGSEYVRITELPEEKFFGDIIKDSAEKLQMDLRLFRAVGDPETKIKKIGWCTGAGAEFIQEAYSEGCGMYITGDVKYHDAQLAKGLGICVLDAGHYGTEKCFVENMACMLSEKTDAEVIRSEIDINPFSW